MVRRQSIALNLSILLFVAAIALPLTAFELLMPEGEYAWLTLLIAFCCLPATIALIRGDFDPFEPVYSISFATFVYFGVMIAVLMSTNSFRMKGIDYRAQVAEVIFLALTALVSFYVAYYAAHARSPRTAAKQPLDGASRVYAHRFSWWVLGLFISLFALWLVVGGIPLRSMWIIGLGEYGSWNEAATGTKLGYLYAAQEALPACVLLLIATRTARRWSLHFILLAVAVTLLLVGLGVRARVLLMLGSLVAFYFLEKRKRPALWQIAALALIVFYAVIGVIGYFRGPESLAAQPGLFTLADAWKHFVAGADIATTTAMYVRWTPVIGFDWGRQFLDLLLTPIPSALWPDKYQFLGVSAVEQFRRAGCSCACVHDLLHELSAASAWFLAWLSLAGFAGRYTTATVRIHSIHLRRLRSRCCGLTCLTSMGDTASLCWCLVRCMYFSRFGLWPGPLTGTVENVVLEGKSIGGWCE